ncbi:MAG: hypothetical protein OXB88_07875 [Bacteriovoracales bacterium]|nr:hypothetical protein [Bacteriovoracales bacterium]
MKPLNLSSFQNSHRFHQTNPILELSVDIFGKLFKLFLHTRQLEKLQKILESTKFMEELRSVDPAFRGPKTIAEFLPKILQDVLSSR